MASESEVDTVLEREPHNIAALVAKGEYRSAAGDDRGAAAFYKAALRAAQAAGALPMSLKPAIEQAQEGIARAEERFHLHQENLLAEAGFAEGNRPPRFQHALDLLNGRTQAKLELQRPTSFYYPGLPQRRYFDASEFAWGTEMEASAAAIREELLAEMAKGLDAFSPYIISNAARPRSNYHGLRDNPDWSTLDLWDKGQPASISARFPKTMAAVGAVDLPRISVRAPNVLFSKLSPGARIPPHHGMINTRLVCHLPLIVPPGCGFRVGGEARLWEEGKLLIFDDSIEHEAWNEGASDRIILIFDAWRLELDADERAAVTALFEAVDSY